MSEVNTERTRQVAEDFTDIRIPRLDELDAEEAAALRSAFLDAEWAPQMAADPRQVDIGIRFIARIPDLCIAPSPTWVVPEKDEEFHWARVRAILAGWGYPAHAALAAELRRIYPRSPIEPRETFEEWDAALREAHRMRGWSPTLAAVPWWRVAERSAVGKDYQPADWEKTLAVLHVLKHTSYSTQHGAVVTYLGTAVRVSADARMTNALVSSPRVSLALLRALRTPGQVGVKVSHPMAVALHWALPKFMCRDLTQRVPVSHLPAGVIHGPGAKYAPSPHDCSGWTQHGVTLEGVRLAAGGKLYHPRDLTLGTYEISGFDWTVDELDPSLAVPAQTWESTVSRVSTYSAQRPSALLARDFPNLRFLSSAHAALLDAVIVAHRIREAVPLLRVEFPLIGILPSIATEDGATNTGKSRLSEVILQAISPGSRLMTVQVDGSNMSGRAAIHRIVTDGSAGFDEWIAPKDPGDLLSFRNLQSLAVGEAATVGQVYGNEGKSVLLRAPLIFNAKAVEFPADMVSRVVFLWVDQLSPEQRENAEGFERAVTGALALDVYLASLAWAETYRVAERMAAAAIPSSRDARYNRHRWLAAAILVDSGEHPTMAAALMAVDAAYAAMADRYHRHTRDADESGLLHTMGTGQTARAHLSAFLPQTKIDALSWRNHIRAVSRNRSAGATAAELARAAALLMGEGVSIREAVRVWFGERSALAALPERSFFRAVLAQLVSRMPEVGARVALPGEAGLCGFVLVRRPPDPTSNINYFALDCENPALS